MLKRLSLEVLLQVLDQHLDKQPLPAVGLTKRFPRENRSTTDSQINQNRKVRVQSVVDDTKTRKSSNEPMIDPVVQAELETAQTTEMMMALAGEAAGAMMAQTEATDRDADAAERRRTPWPP